MSLKKYFEEVLEELDSCESQMERLQLVLEYGKDLGEFDNSLKIDENKVPGCTSNVYIHCERKGDVLEYSASSDALIVGGYIALILEGINGRSAKEIINSKELIEDFTKKGGIKESLTPTRANAFGNILNLIFIKAQSFF